MNTINKFDNFIGLLNFFKFHVAKNFPAHNVVL